MKRFAIVVCAVVVLAASAPSEAACRRVRGWRFWRPQATAPAACATCVSVPAADLPPSLPRLPAPPMNLPDAPLGAPAK